MSTAANGEETERRARRVQRMCEEILSAAERVIAREGLLKTNMQQIAEEAQIAKGTLYLYFRDKSDLMLSLVGRTDRRITESMKAAIGSSDSPEDQLRLVLKTSLDLYKGNIDFHKVIFVEFLRGETEDNPLVQQMQESAKHRADMLATVYKRGVKIGAFRKLPPYFAVEMLSGMFHHLLMMQMREPDLFAKEDYGEMIFDLFLRGISVSSPTPTAKKSRTK